MTKWNNSLKSDFQKITMSSNLKTKINQRQPIKKKTSTIRPLIASAILVAIMCLVLIQSSTPFLSLNKQASLNDVTNNFSELYIERVEESDITMHRSGLYSGIVAIDEAGRQNFSKLWNNKQEVKIDRTIMYERQFLAYDQEGQKISGTLLSDGENGKLYLEKGDKQFNLFISNKAFQEKLNFSEENYAFIILFMLLLAFVLFWDVLYENKSKQNKVISSIGVFVFIIGANLNLFLPVVVVLFIILAVWRIIIRGEKVVTNRQLLIINYIYVVCTMICIGILNYFMNLNLMFLIYLIATLVLVSSLFEKRLDKYGAISCPHCEKEFGLLYVLKKKIVGNSTSCNCKNCGKKVEFDKRSRSLKDMLPFLVVVGLVIVGVFINMPNFIVYPFGIINFILMLLVNLTTNNEEKIEKPMW